MNDRGLVDALRARDANALAELYDKYAESVYRYCWTLTGGPDGAQVALRDTMIAVEARIHALTDPARFKVWLYALARGECLRRRASGAPAGAETEPGYTGLSAVARDAVQSLAPADREILELVHRHGFTLPDAARVLGVSRRQAKIRYGAAAERLFEAVTAELRGRESQVFGLLPQTVLPESLRVRVMSCFVDPDLLPYRRLVARRVGPLDASGFPVGGERRLIRGMTAGAASVAVALAVALAFNQFWLSGGTGVVAAPGASPPAQEPADLRTAPETTSTVRPRAATPASSSSMRPYNRMPVVGIGLPTPPRPAPATPSAGADPATMPPSSAVARGASPSDPPAERTAAPPLAARAHDRGADEDEPRRGEPRRNRPEGGARGHRNDGWRDRDRWRDGSGRGHASDRHGRPGRAFTDRPLASGEMHRGRTPRRPGRGPSAAPSAAPSPAPSFWRPRTSASPWPSAGTPRKPYPDSPSPVRDTPDGPEHARPDPVPAPSPRPSPAAHTAQPAQAAEAARPAEP